MKRNIFIFSVVLLISCDIQAQKSTPARLLAEKGTQGDIILGKENKKGQLSATPQILQPGDPLRKKEAHSKKIKNKKI